MEAQHVFIYLVPRRFFGPRLFQELEDTLFGKVNHDNGFTLMILLFQKESGITVLLLTSNVFKNITNLSMNMFSEDLATEQNLPWMQMIKFISTKN